MGYMRPEVKAFAEEMEKQLAANAHKGGWDVSDPGFFVSELDNHLGAVRRQLFRGDTHSKADKAQLADDCADIANFAMMIADVCEALPEKPARSDLAEAARRNREASEGSFSPTHGG